MKRPRSSRFANTAVVPQALDQRAATAAEHEQMAVVRIALECLLHQQPVRRFGGHRMDMLGGPVSDLGIAAGKMASDFAVAVRAKMRAPNVTQGTRRLASASTSRSSHRSGPEQGVLIRARERAAAELFLAALRVF